VKHLNTLNKVRLKTSGRVKRKRGGGEWENQKGTEEDDKGKKKKGPAEALQGTFDDLTMEKLPPVFLKP